MERAPFDKGASLSLIHIYMPEMDGFELTKAIRSGETSKKHIPIVALTANALKGEREHCLSAGMDDYLSKPVQLEDLRLTLEKYLSGDKLAEKSKSTSQLPVQTDVVESIAVPINVHALEELIGNDPEMIKEMLLDFRGSAERIATELRAAYQAGQFAAVGSLAHKLKSSARSVGALALGELCAEMEQAAKKNDAGALAVLLPSFDVQLMSVKSYLEALHAEG